MTNQELVEKFYRCFEYLDGEGMVSCLAEDTIYNDPIYGIIKGEYAAGLWRMRCKNLVDMKIDIIDFVELDHEYIKCKWNSTFFSRSSAKQISMTMTSFMKINDQKITEHSDAYRLSDWLAKAYGLTGILFGWSGWMKKREQSRYRTMLEKFVQNQKLFKGQDKLEHDSDFSDR